MDGLTHWAHRESQTCVISNCLLAFVPFSAYCIFHLTDVIIALVPMCKRVEDARHLTTRPLYGDLRAVESELKHLALLPTRGGVLPFPSCHLHLRGGTVRSFLQCLDGACPPPQLKLRGREQACFFLVSISIKTFLLTMLSPAQIGDEALRKVCEGAVSLIEFLVPQVGKYWLHWDGDDDDLGPIMPVSSDRCLLHGMTYAASS